MTVEWCMKVDDFARASIVGVKNRLHLEAGHADGEQCTSSHEYEGYPSDLSKVQVEIMGQQATSGVYMKFYYKTANGIIVYPGSMHLSD